MKGPASFAPSVMHAVVMTLSAEEALPVSDLEPPSASPVPRVLGVVVAVLLVAAIVSAVLVGNTEVTAAERFAAIPGAVAEEPFAFEMTMGSLPIPGEGDAEITMQGAADPAKRRMKAEMDLSAVLPDGMGFPPKISMVADGDVAYLLVPTSPGAPPRWQKVDNTALTKGATGGLPSSTNPLDSFEQLRSVDAEIEELGEEEVRGTKTTRFRTRISMQKVLEAMPAERRPPAGSPEAALFATMPDVPVEVWLDDEDRPRRQRMTFSIPADPTGARPAMEMSMQIEAFDFGKAVTIDLPPADQIDDSGLFGGSTPGS